MSWLFVDANHHPIPGSNKFNGDISYWDVFSVTDMNNMFAMLVTLDTSHLDMSPENVFASGITR